MAKKDNLIVGLDFGTTKICVIVAQIKNNKLEIIGVGKSTSTGIRKGVVINIDATTDSICKAVEEAEMVSGVKIENVYAGIAGNHIKGFNSHGVVAIKNNHPIFSFEGVYRVYRVNIHHLDHLCFSFSWL